MKLFWLFVISSITLHTAFAQTYVEPLVGVSFSKNFGDPPRSNSYVKSDKNFNNKNWLLGLSLSQKLTTQLSIQLAGKFSKQTVGNSDDTGLTEYADFTFAKTQYTIMPVYQFISHFEFGLGINYAQLRRFYYGDRSTNYFILEGEIYKENQLGCSSRFSYLYKSMVLSINYHYLKAIDSRRRVIRKSNHIEIVLAYRIKLLNRISLRKKVDCPKISK